MIIKPRVKKGRSENVQTGFFIVLGFTIGRYEIVKDCHFTTLPTIMTEKITLVARHHKFAVKAII